MHNIFVHARIAFECAHLYVHVRARACGGAGTRSSALYLFPCQHALHMHCVEYYMLRNGGLSAADKKRVKQLKASLHAEDVRVQKAQERSRRTAPDALANEPAGASADYSRMQVRALSQGDKNKIPPAGRRSVNFGLQKRVDEVFAQCFDARVASCSCWRQRVDSGDV